MTCTWWWNWRTICISGRKGASFRLPDRAEKKPTQLSGTAGFENKKLFFRRYVYEKKNVGSFVSRRNDFVIG